MSHTSAKILTVEISGETPLDFHEDFSLTKEPFREKQNTFKLLLCVR